jgi:hypothetical protein
MFEYELETGLDRESECEFANEYESEQFLPLLAPVLKAAAPMAIQAIGGLLSRRRKRGQRESEFEFEFESLQSEYEDEYEGDPFIGNLLKGLSGALGSAEGESEFESEFEFESTPMNEYELVMENLAYRAAHSESEAEAEAFLGALVPLAARLIPSAAKAITSVAPSLVRGVAKMGRALYKSPTTRQLLQTAPTILKGTVGTLARQVEQGKPLSGTTALRALAGNAANVLGSQQKTKRTLRRSHRAQHQRMARPNGKRRPALA